MAEGCVAKMPWSRELHFEVRHAGLQQYRDGGAIYHVELARTLPKPAGWGIPRVDVLMFQSWREAQTANMPPAMVKHV